MANRDLCCTMSLQLRAGQTLGVVGESGSGKSTLGRILLGLERPEQGQVRLAGQDWLALSAAQRRQARQGIQVVFQDPLASFDPRYTVLRVLAEALAQVGVLAGCDGPRRPRCWSGCSCRWPCSTAGRWSYPVASGNASPLPAPWP